MASVLHAHLSKPVILGYRRNGAPIWSVAGAEDNGAPAGGQQQQSGQGTDSTQQGQQQQTQQQADPGFPANTPIEQMNADQREAYWKHQARKHEDRVKAFGGLTTEQLTDLREKAGKHDQMERDLLSGTEKAVAEAKDAGTAETKAAYIPKLVNAELRAAAAGSGVSSEALNTALEYVDQTKFLTKNGEDVDTDKVTKFIAGIAPAKGNRKQRQGPSTDGFGARNNATGSGADKGRAEAIRRGFIKADA